MAVTSGFFNAIDHDRLYNAEDVGSLLDGIITDGILNTYGSHFEVSHEEDGGLDVIVGSGRGWFKQTWILNDDNLTLTAEPNISGNARYDTVAIDVNKSDDIRANTIIIVTGTNDPAGADLIDEGGHKQYPIANVKIDATGTTVEEVIDRRDEVYAQNPAVLKPYWPINSIFMTLDDNFNPTVAFGGTWERIKGKFLLGADEEHEITPGSEGGSWDHEIKETNLPSHTHGTGNYRIGFNSANVRTYRFDDLTEGVSVMGWAQQTRGLSSTDNSNYLTAAWNLPYGYSGTQVSGETPPLGASNYATTQVALKQDAHNHSISGESAPTGGGTKITIKPPYLAVYMWKRVS